MRSIENLLPILQAKFRNDYPAALAAIETTWNDGVTLPAPAEANYIIHQVKVAPVPPCVAFIGDSTEHLSDYNPGAQDYRHHVRVVLLVDGETEEAVHKRAWRYADAAIDLIFADMTGERVLGYLTEVTGVEYGQPTQQGGKTYITEAVVNVTITRRVT